jgi:hypothetical protein
MPLFRRDRETPPSQPADPVDAVPADAVPPPPPPGTGQYPTARIEPGNGDAVLAELLGHAARADWESIRRILSAYDGEDFIDLVDQLCHQGSKMDEWLPAAVKEDGGLLVQLVFGARAINRAWEIRTGKVPKYVSKEQFAAFKLVLREAEGILNGLLKRDRDSAAVWFFLMQTGRGLGIGLSTIHERFMEVDRRCPGNLPAHRQLLQASCQKWAGSHEIMHSFAQRSLQGRYGDRLAELVARAHIEQRQSIQDKDARKTYIRSAPVRQSLLQAFDMSTVCRDSAKRPSRTPYYTQNTFAMALSLSAMQPAAFAAFEATEGVVDGPWTYINSRNPVYVYNVWRDWSRTKY